MKGVGGALIGLLASERRNCNLPVKRFITLPVSKGILDKQTLISLGGAEQNLALVHLVNRARWENPDCTIGIAENVF